MNGQTFSGGRPFYYVLLSILIAAFLLLTFGSVLIGRLSLTYDEPQHFRYGEQILEGNSDRFDDSKMPMSVLNAAASKAVTALAGNLIGSEWQAMSTGRSATIAFSLLVGLLCAVWASRLGGRWAGLLAFGLYAFEPNILAHSTLITTDIYAAGTITFALFLYSLFLEAPSLRRGVFVGLALGLALIAKYSSLLLFPLFPLLAILRYRRSLTDAIRRKASRGLLRTAIRWSGYYALFLATSLVVVNGGFLFNRTGTPLGEYSLLSPQLRAVQASSPLLRRVPVPVPYPYLEGLDRVMYNDRTGENYGRIYLLGRLKQGKGFPGYFFVAALYKVPLGLLALFALALWDWVNGLRRGSSEWGRTYLLVSILVFALYFNLFFRAQIGLRFFLVVFPPALVFTAQLGARWRELGKGVRAGVVALGVYVVISVLSYFPDFIPYFNELVPDRALAYRVLSDSNIIWGQSNASVEEALAEHPEYVLEPDQPTAGTIVVGVNRLTGVLGDPETFRWLREGFTPVGHFRYTHLIFEVSPSDVDALAAPDGGE